MDNFNVEQFEEINDMLGLYHGRLSDSVKKTLFERWVRNYGPGQARSMMKKTERVLRAQERMFNKKY